VRSSPAGKWNEHNQYKQYPVACWKCKQVSWYGDDGCATSWCKNHKKDNKQDWTRGPLGLWAAPIGIEKEAPEVPPPRETASALAGCCWPPPPELQPTWQQQQQQQQDQQLLLQKQQQQQMQQEQQQQLLLQQQQQQMPAWDNALTPWAPGQSSGGQAPNLAMQQARLLQQMQLQQLQQQQLLLQQQQLQQQQQQGPGWDKSKAPWNAPPAAAPAGPPSNVDIDDRGQTLSTIKQLLLQFKKEDLLAHPTLDDTSEQEEEPADVGPKRPEGCMKQKAKCGARTRAAT
jgi:hypothetical protein